MIMVGVAGRKSLGIGEMQQRSINNCWSYMKTELQDIILCFEIC